MIRKALIYIAILIISNSWNLYSMDNYVETIINLVKENNLDLIDISNIHIEPEDTVICDEISEENISDDQLTAKHIDQLLSLSPHIYLGDEEITLNINGKVVLKKIKPIDIHNLKSRFVYDSNGNLSNHRQIPKGANLTADTAKALKAKEGIHSLRKNSKVKPSDKDDLFGMTCRLGVLPEVDSELSTLFNNLKITLDK